MTVFLLALSVALNTQSQATATLGDGAQVGGSQTPADKQAMAIGTSQGPALSGKLSAGPVGQSVPSLSASAVEASTSGASASRDAKLELMLRRQEDMANNVKALKPSLLKELAPAILSVFGVLLGAALANASTSRLQKRRLENESKATRAMAGISAASKLMDFKSRQLYELYAPLEALLLQNLTVRGELYRMLIKSGRSDRIYEMKPDPEGQKGESLFVVPADGSAAIPFRLIEQMGYLLTHHGPLLGTVKEIVSINDQIVKLLHEKIGLVRSENRELSKGLGVLLAHQSVLRAAANPVNNDNVLLPSYTTTFPRGLDTLVKKDADKLLAEIKDWEARTGAWMEPFESNSTGGAR
ncbi:hypothetical protein QTJ10_10980 [Xanthomonas hortorum pv. vitians]|uniref:hypothetical protein n=1 Tax=Xanthomonas hortorum TaxID=56454 RepID=UPI0025A26DE2|nr:hypothetical protein [Xanthomonas hortorum]WJM78533.1 hypothetical protein QTJ10_10980 [Xanthomonas hortorum pv. vitians]